MQKQKKTLTLSNELLGDIEMALDDNSYEMEWYLDIQEEETTFLCDPAITGEYELMEELERQIEQDNKGRFIPIPMSPSHEGWRVMEQFILSLDGLDEQTRDLLLNTIQGTGAFSRFKDAVHRIGRHEEWYEFRDRKNRRKVLDWLYAEGLITEQDIEKGMQLYEDQLQRRKRRKQEIADMTTGTKVTCRTDSAHEDKLTVGKAYDVLDEQREHRNIRIRDDRGKLVWLPKGHFELVIE